MSFALKGGSQTTTIHNPHNIRSNMAKFNLVVGLTVDEGTGEVYSFSSEVLSGSTPQDSADILKEHNNGKSPEQILLIVVGQNGPEVKEHWNVDKDYE